LFCGTVADNLLLLWFTFRTYPLHLSTQIDSII
jgi:hypothetical protein